MMMAEVWDVIGGGRWVVCGQLFFPGARWSKLLVCRGPG